MRAFLALFAAAALLVSCAGDEPTDFGDDATAEDVTVSPDVPGSEDDSAPGETTAPDGGLSSCLDRPNELPRPPTSGLPCELIPPGLTL